MKIVDLKSPKVFFVVIVIAKNTARMVLKRVLKRIFSDIDVKIVAKTLQ